MAVALMTSLAAVYAGVVNGQSAQAEGNGVGLKPALGWSSWSFIRHDPTAAKIDAQADAMKSSSLAAVSAGVQ
jgi:alpha-galactosidase